MFLSQQISDIIHKWLTMLWKMRNIAQIYTHLHSQYSSSGNNHSAADFQWAVSADQ